MKHIIIIINYNNYTDSINCANAINKLDGNKKIIIVDNCSNNDSFMQLSNQFKNIDNIEVIKTKDNLGYSKGIDYAYKYIKEQNYSYDFIHVSNSDIIVKDTDFLKRVETDYHNNPFYLLGPSVITNGVNTSPIGYFKKASDFEKEMKKLNILASGLKIFTRLTFGAFENKLESNRNGDIAKKVCAKLSKGEKIVPILSGCYVIFSKDHTDRFDYLYRPITFLYNEEMLITYTLMSQGIRQIYFDDKLKVCHYHGGSSKGASIKKANYIKQNYKEFKKLGLYKNEH